MARAGCCGAHPYWLFGPDAYVEQGVRGWDISSGIKGQTRLAGSVREALFAWDNGFVAQLVRAPS
jgi:hypothetical protein